MAVKLNSGGTGVDKAAASINQKINQELEELLESLPEKMVFDEPVLAAHNKDFTDGFNQAISEVHSIIQAKIKESE